MATITDHDARLHRAEVHDLFGERTFADVSDQFDPPDLAIFDDELRVPGAVGQDDELCCGKCP